MSLQVYNCFQQWGKRQMRYQKSVVSHVEKVMLYACIIPNS